jgi:hypothetical protein
VLLIAGKGVAKGRNEVDRQSSDISGDNVAPS